MVCGTDSHAIVTLCGHLVKSCDHIEYLGFIVYLSAHGDKLVIDETPDSHAKVMAYNISVPTAR